MKRTEAVISAVIVAVLITVGEPVLLWLAFKLPPSHVDVGLTTVYELWGAVLFVVGLAFLLWAVFSRSEK